MKKVFLSILVAAFFATFIIACGSKTDDVDDQDTTNQDQVDSLAGDVENQMEDMQDTVAVDTNAAE